MNIIPPAFQDNPSARKIINHAYEKKQREGRWGGYWTNELAELLGATPDIKEAEYPSEVSTYDPGTPEEVAEYLSNPF